MPVDQVRRWSDELARDPRSLAFLQLADELRRRRQLGDALAVALRGLERHPYLPDAHDVLARVHADMGDEQRARDEWETALELEPRHLPSLKGLGFLDYRRGDYARAEKHLRLAAERDDADRGLEAALARLRERRESAPEPDGNGNGARHAGRGNSAAPMVQSARTLFAPLLGEDDRTALLVDRDGLVVAGCYVDDEGRDVGDEIGAVLAGIGEESTRALAHLHLGAWHAVTVEAQHATVALAPCDHDNIVVVAAARDTNVGLVRRLLVRARERAVEWLRAVT